jgi:antibiotic biosynthesis monooxygenase (ABM) superfamily enzyme
MTMGVLMRPESDAALLNSGEDGGSGVFFIVRHHVKPGMNAEYEKWLKKLMFKAAEFPGHLGVQVIKPSDGSDEFTIAVRFQSEKEAKDWQDSHVRQEIAAESHKYLRKQEFFEMHSGIDFWFTPGSVAPPKWKQWILTTVVIWPLSVVIPLSLLPIFDYLGMPNIFTIYQAIFALVIVGIATYWAMPWCTHFVYRWLYSKT